MNAKIEDGWSHSSRDEIYMEETKSSTPFRSRSDAYMQLSDYGYDAVDLMFTHFRRIPSCADLVPTKWLADQIDSNLAYECHIPELTRRYIQLKANLLLTAPVAYRSYTKLQVTPAIRCAIGSQAWRDMRDDPSSDANRLAHVWVDTATLVSVGIIRTHDATMEAMARARDAEHEYRGLKISQKHDPLKTDIHIVTEMSFQGAERAIVGTRRLVVVGLGVVGHEKSWRVYQRDGVSNGSNMKTLVRHMSLWAWLQYMRLQSGFAPCDDEIKWDVSIE